MSALRLVQHLLSGLAGHLNADPEQSVYLAALGVPAAAKP